MERPTPALQKEKISTHRQEIMEQLLQIKTMISGFESFLPNLLNYLQTLCNTFKAGQVVAHFAAWMTLTSDKVPSCLMFWERVLNVLLPLFNIDCLTKPFRCKSTPLFVRKCINYLRKVSSQRYHLGLGKSCLVFFSAPRRWVSPPYT